MYLKWAEKTIADFSDNNINSLYSRGFLFARTGRGEMYQTRSLRIDLNKFELFSENRRVLRKTEEIRLNIEPLPYAHYDWTIGKMAKNFYDTKFGDKTFSANKIKELMMDGEKSNFNIVLIYSIDTRIIGYTICYQNSEIFHYCYPFYQLTINNERLTIPNLGLGMMLKAILWAQEQNKKYVYLGSFSRPTDTYKLQFAGLEWWNGERWKNDLEKLKQYATPRP